MAHLVISYSREDLDLVRVIVRLLKASLMGLDETVFWDDDFEPGEPWFEQLKSHIDQAPQLFVFWCRHAAASSAVRREYVYAIAQGKRVVPVLLDDTPLSEELATIHGIDVREAIPHDPVYYMINPRDPNAPRSDRPIPLEGMLTSFARELSVPLGELFTEKWDDAAFKSE